MKHKISLKLLSDYVDKRCSEEDFVKIESHLSKCDSCRKTLRILKNLNLTMTSMPVTATSPDFDYGFNRKLNRRIKLKQEKALKYRIDGILETIENVLILPAPVLAKATSLILLILFAYGILNYYLVELPAIAFIKGSVSIYSARQKKWITPTEGLRLSKGDILKVDEGSFMDINQMNKYTMRIKGDSRIKLTRLLPRYINGKTAYYAEKGKAFVSITKEFKGSKFVIRTPEAVATALGTEFLIDVSIRPAMMTRLGVLEGKVKIKSLFKPGETEKLRQVIVKGGEATEVYKDRVPISPRKLLDKEWLEMTEFYQIGKKRRVILLISNGKHRTRELLRPCPIYISEVEPRTFSKPLEETIKVIDDAIKTKDRTKHLKGIKELEQIIDKYPSPDYEPQLLLFIGTYYNYLNMPESALQTFQRVVDKYPKSTFASMALYAIGIIYDEKIKDKTEAESRYNLILDKYPRSPEAEAIREVKKKIVRKK